LTGADGGRHLEDVIPVASDPHAIARVRVGQMLNGKWHIDRLIDVGGMGAVYESTHRNGRRAAIKILHAQYANHPEIRRRFMREGYVANKIEHPGAVAILDDDVAEDGAPFLVMELLEGEALSGTLTRAGGRMGIIEALAVCGQVLEVLAVAHGNGIVHRDIKPANIFVTRGGHAKLLDFGLARIRDGQVSLIPTAVGIVMGTAGYLAPEQARGQPDLIDARTDIFAVGAVLYRAVSGRRIHEMANAFDMTIAAMREPVGSLAAALPTAGPALVTAVDRALAFERDARWPSARLMFEALRTAYEEEARLNARAPISSAATSINVDALTEAPSLVVDVAFGEEHDVVIELERRRTREVIDGLSTVSIAVDSSALRGGGR
jgi:serine/threonine protein kinase